MHPLTLEVRKHMQQLPREAIQDALTKRCSTHVGATPTPRDVIISGATSIDGEYGSPDPNDCNLPPPTCGRVHDKDWTCGRHPNLVFSRRRKPKANLADDE